jgi:hypothetical protein
MPKVMLDSGSVPTSSACGPPECEGECLSLESLPDELIAMCYSSLPARDLVTLELVCRRLRDLVCGDENAWKACAEVAWGRTHNFDLMNMAVASAGTWKALYATKKAADVTHSPWNVPSIHEVRAIMERTWNRAPQTRFGKRLSMIALLSDGAFSFSWSWSYFVVLAPNNPKFHFSYWEVTVLPEHGQHADDLSHKGRGCTMLSGRQPRLEHWSVER